MKVQLTKKKLIHYSGFYLTLTVLAFLRAIGTYVFIVPNAFAPGGVGGIASMLYNVIAIYNSSLANGWFNPAVTVFIMNAPLLIAAFFKLNKQFAVNSLIVVALYSGFMGLFSLVNFPVFKGSGMESSVTILAAIAGGVLSGISLGGTLLTNSSAGGTDIVGKLSYARNPDLNVQWQIFMFDSIVVLLSGVMGLITAKGQDSNTVFVNVATPVLYSFISLFITSEVADVLTTGMQSSVVFNIVTSKPEAISEAIVKILNRSATTVTGEGAYSYEPRKIVICVVRKKQSTMLKTIIKDVDPDSFVYINKAKEVNGFGFRSGN